MKIQIDNNNNNFNIINFLLFNIELNIVIIKHVTRYLFINFNMHLGQSSWYQ